MFKKSTTRQFCISVSSLILLGLSCQAQAQQTLCTVPPIQFSSEQLMQEGHIKVSAKQAEIIEERTATFMGDVQILSNTARISAEQALVEENGKRVTAKGNVRYQDPVLKVDSTNVSVDSIAKSLQLDNSRYQLAGFVGRGEAEHISVQQSDGVKLEDVTFTTCPLGGEDWQIKASSISLKPGSPLGEARNTRFYVGDIPVFYLPYFAFPVSTERQSGLLFPNITSSTSTGVDIEQPYYWNIAPNYDLTLSPRLMTNRGLQFKTEFRYLTNTSYGQLNLEYLPEDTDIDDRPDRYFYRLTHEGQLSENWYVSVNVNGMSDENYIVDLGSDFYNRADTHMVRTLGVNYYSDELNASIYLKDFEIIGTELSTYRALPEFKLDYKTHLSNALDFELTTEAAYFDNAATTEPTAFRLHVAPTLSIPYRRQWGELSAQATLFNTYYQQDNLSQDSPLEDDVTRTIGQARLYGALFFERQGSWLSDDATTTLEPKFQYLYTSYENQDSIGFYDSTALLTDVDGLFRGREFTGLDRISDNNQVTVGVTSRVIDQKNREQFVFSIGQTFYFADSRVATFRNQDNRSAVAAEIDWRIDAKWFLHADMQLASETEKVDRSSFTLEYRESEQKLVQFTQRYVRNLSGEKIDQLGLSASWPIAKNWQWVGRVYRDMERHRSVELYTGIEYESCCWALRVVAQRHLSNRFNMAGAQSTDEYDSGIALQFTFKGVGTRSSNRQMLKDGMFGYRQPYSLN
ncbi:LPS-assembly protein LptD [Alteromonas sediminis]|uniref:LPS-assembly protein LptD n=1 Tax=Alteromonas sediminis TaxID=2259342 RepID=A0A3N5YAF9_9ALTE|nr:LPS assembly protein LptD [Alteromonas sediminis]RPJ65755.1 LPS-assembly protein LptD [Alteromonas sediminis]